ncbi:MAG: hypothetical protein IT445_04220 [Phycisphaeraceae bacterium]|nr:hypothetical protein [Phycisphaeraceae bacterium]
MTDTQVDPGDRSRKQCGITRPCAEGKRSRTLSGLNQRLIAVGLTAVLSVICFFVLSFFVLALMGNAGGLLISIVAAGVTAIVGSLGCAYMMGYLCSTRPTVVDPLWGASSLYLIAIFLALVPVAIPDGWNVYADFPAIGVVGFFAWIMVTSYLCSTLGFMRARRHARSGREC